MAKSGAAEAAPSSGQAPILYSKLVALQSDVHSDLKVRQAQDVSFAASTNAIPVVLDEVIPASRHYPIVFSAVNPGVMLAIVGVRQNQNLFVDKDGKWAEGVYIPAYVRRYPFFMAQTNPDTDEKILCFDEGTDLLSTTDGQPLFEDGKGTTALQQVLRFSNSLQLQLERTSEFANALASQEMLGDKQAVFRTDGSEDGKLAGFQVVDREKLSNMTPKRTKEWLGNGWLDACVLQLASLGNFDRLKSMDRDR